MTTIADTVISDEQIVLGNLLLGVKNFDDVASLINAKDFTNSYHQKIFDAIASLVENEGVVNWMLVWEKLGGYSSKENDPQYLNDLVMNAVGNTKFYAKRIAQSGKLKRLAEIGDFVNKKCAEWGAMPDEIASLAESEMTKVIDRSDDDPVSLFQAMEIAIGDITNRELSDDARGGMLSGIPELDDLVQGFEPGQLIVIAARPSVGKTAMAINLINNVSNYGKCSLFFSLEMTKKEIAQRFIALRGAISQSMFRQKKLSNDTWGTVANVFEQSQESQIFIHDKGGITLLELKAKATKVAKNNELGMIVVDFIGLMKGDGENRNQQIGAVSRGLKVLAKEFNVPIIALAQLNRGVENDNRKPVLSDLRDSGEIEQDADIVAMLHRTQQANQLNPISTIEVIVRKNRNGPIGEFVLDLHAPTGRMSSSTQFIQDADTPKKVSIKGYQGLRG